jgi:hypothetical protein
VAEFHELVFKRAESYLSQQKIDERLFHSRQRWRGVLKHCAAQLRLLEHSRPPDPSSESSQQTRMHTILKLA